MRIRAITILVAALALAACDDDETVKGEHALSFRPLALEPSTVIQAGIVPGTLPFTPLLGVGCPGISAFTTAFDLVVFPVSGERLRMDRVTFRLLDGTSVGGPSVTIPKPQLETMFGSTFILGRTIFPFRPQFGCLAARPLFVVAEVDLEDGKAMPRRIEARAAF